MNKSRTPLLSDFEKHTTEQWQAQIEKELKGKPIDDLTYMSQDGIATAPFYDSRTSDRFIWKNESGNQWLITEKIEVTNAVEANKIALNALMNGANALWFFGNIEDNMLPDLLNGIELSFITLFIVPNQHTKTLAEAYQIYLSGKKLEPNQCKGGIVSQPYSNAATIGSVDNLDVANHTIISCNGLNWRNAGASIVQELAIFLSEANEYLGNTKLMEELSDFIIFKTGISTDYFYEIAKLRATRILWQNLINGYKVNTPLHIHAESSSFNLALFDKHNNLLRTTTEAMSAILGGCNSLSLSAFDAPEQEKSELGARLARNIQSILGEESYFGNIADPAAGAYYIEQLTTDTAQSAWQLFQQIEKEGGYLKALQNNQLQTMVEASFKQQKQDYNNGNIIMLGVNRFPNASETISKHHTTENTNPINKGKTFKTIQKVRLTAEQELQRISNQK